MRGYIGWLCVLVSIPLLASALPAAEFASPPAATPSTILSTPVEQDGVAVSLEVRQSPVPADAQPEFIVRFTNVGKDYRNLYDVGSFWNWTINLANTDAKPLIPGPWRLRMHVGAIIRPVEDWQIKPGESRDFLIDLNAPPLTFDWVYTGGAEDRPIRPRRFLPPGRYQATAVVSLPNFPIGDDKHYWLGPVTTQPVELTISETPFKVGTPAQLAAYDAAIAHVISKLDSYGEWTNGAVPNVPLAKEAYAEDVIDAAVNASIAGSKDYRVLRVQPFKKEQTTASGPGYAALLRVGTGYRVLLLFPFAQGGWWSRFYDATLAPPANRALP